MFDYIDLLIISILVSSNQESIEDCSKMLNRYLMYKSSFELNKSVNEKFEKEKRL